MQIGRRNFIRALAATAMSALDAGRAIALVEDLYVNRRLGFSFRKPTNWHFGDIREMGKVAQGQVLALEDPGTARWLKEEAELPVVVVSRDRLRADSSTFTPGVNVFCDWMDEPADLSALRIADVEQNTRLLRNFKTLPQGSPCFEAGQDCMEYRASFLFEHERLRTPVPVVMRTVATLQPPAVVTFRMFDAPEAGQGFDFRNFWGSVQLV